MKKFDVTIDLGSYYAEKIEAKTKEEAEKIAIQKYKTDVSDGSFYPEYWVAETDEVGE